MKRRDDILLVDGYNMIGAWPVLEKLKAIDLEEARDKLLDMLADYQGFTGMAVYIIFDAHQVPGLGATFKHHKLTIVYTKEKETADECIERMVVELYKKDGICTSLLLISSNSMSLSLMGRFASRPASC